MMSYITSRRLSPLLKGFINENGGLRLLLSMPFLIEFKEYGWPPITYMKSEKKGLRSIIPPGWPILITAWMAILLCRFKKNASFSSWERVRRSILCRSSTTFTYLHSRIIFKFYLLKQQAQGSEPLIPPELFTVADPKVVQFKSIIRGVGLDYGWHYAGEPSAHCSRVLGLRIIYHPSEVVAFWYERLML